jgi:two-component system response regulator AtoC
VLEERSFKRVGGVKEYKVDVRLIAATNKNLEQLAATGRFREDLLYRLNVFKIEIPPLRERGEDILLLARHFMQDFARQLGKRITVIDPETECALLASPFPGNVRQLRNLVEQAVIVARGERLTFDLFRSIQPPPAWSAADPPQSATPAAPRPSESEPRAPLPPLPKHGTNDTPLDELVTRLNRHKQELIQFELEVIDRALASTKGNKTKAAELLGVSRYALLRSLRRLNNGADQ